MVLHKKKNKYGLAIASMMLFSSCATIINSPRQLIYFTSKPSGAFVFINDTSYGKTPVDINMKRKIKERHVILRLEGYETTKVEMERKVNGLVFLNLAFGILPGLVDVLTGSMYKIVPYRITVELKPSSK
jgi:hypothetical protein